MKKKKKGGKKKRKNSTSVDDFQRLKLSAPPRSCQALVHAGVLMLAVPGLSSPRHRHLHCSCPAALALPIASQCNQPQMSQGSHLHPSWAMPHSWMRTILITQASLSSEKGLGRGERRSKHHSERVHKYAEMYLCIFLPFYGHIFLQFEYQTSQ